MNGQAAVEIERPRAIPTLLGASVDLFFRVPILFLALAAVVVVPYELIVLLVTGEGPLALGRTGFVTSNLVTLADFFLATPLISALHIHAVREVGEGGRPRVLPTFRQSLPALPMVALATGISWIGILVGTLALVVPGLMLWARWAVVAQTAALEGGGWTDALKRSGNLTADRRWHALGLVFVAGMIALVPTLALGAIFGHHSTTVASFAAATALQVLVRSFEALALALLFFDLKARLRDEPAPVAKPDSSTPGQVHVAEEADPTAVARATDGHTGHPLDPDVYSDEVRPAGRYVDPDRPWRMRYWRTEGDARGWSKETTKTPEDAQSRWRDLRWRR